MDKDSPLVPPWRAESDERKQFLARRTVIGLLISGAMPQVAWPRCLPLRLYALRVHRDRLSQQLAGPGIPTVIP